MHFQRNLTPAVALSCKQRRCEVCGPFPWEASYITVETTQAIIQRYLLQWRRLHEIEDSRVEGLWVISFHAPRGVGVGGAMMVKVGGKECYRWLCRGGWREFWDGRWSGVHVFEWAMLLTLVMLFTLRAANCLVVFATQLSEQVVYTYVPDLFFCCSLVTTLNFVYRVVKCYQRVYYMGILKGSCWRRVGVGVTHKNTSHNIRNNTQTWSSHM